MSFKILIVTPAKRGSRKGNRITAERLANLIASREFSVAITTGYRSESCDLLIALHARKSAPAIVRNHISNPGRPCVLVLTGTDLYHDIAVNKSAQASLRLATRIVLLQPDGIHHLAVQHKRKAISIFQSAESLVPKPRPSRRRFDICVAGHLRPVKDPFRAALAARLLPPDSKIRVVQIGGALTRAMELRARREMVTNPRYVWLGELSHHATLRKMATCQLLVLTSKLEGGANVISEAIVNGVPVISSRISGSIGLLGANYPGFFEPGDTRGLRDLLVRAETDEDFLARLKSDGQKLRSNFSPRREAAAWRNLIRDTLLGR